ncbi:hypothetical protein LTR99_004202 [Exophiala xenobiotica]|uniref:Bromo domain-containing protein n=1 Tax=Vermiconidia calcicola TaxID=1690605 RepID=A0AAV9QM31_9PEZI|nr:hypothetical protein LTR99_004202 [Exophiala xenobiotica]KAK5435671.1 hypothetical protein LTR34_003175 [Exophiala xenobiotica]KAK5538349.1 hypothetical protein LTR23_006974 [Chaetothyriales sp. CCFEE 6169]KAK5545037.1 hypothetical protein LTR25_000044 [Vermiconidia calcicola]KAK5556949.1 hypothetical protein LTR46_004760 [Exophiala xenobiotica]
MPSLKAYTPYETLAFCQSVAHHGSDTSAFEDIAKSLNANQLIRDSQTYDQNRLTAAALQGLYQDLLIEEKTADTPVVNGDDGNLRKRKLSTSPPPSEDRHNAEEKSLQSLVDKLYATFREQTIKAIRLEEEAYRKIEAEIADLEKKDEDEQRQQTTSEETKPTPRPKDGAPKVAEAQTSPEAAAAQLQASLDASRAEQKAEPSKESRLSPSAVRPTQPQLQPAVASPATPSAPTARVSAEPVPSKPTQAPRPPQPSPGTYQRPSPQRQEYVPNSQPYPPQAHPMQMVSHAQTHMPPPIEYPGSRRSPSGQGRGSPVPMQQQQFAPYQGYQQPWPHPPQHYPPPPPYPNQFYPYHTPQAPQFQHYPQSAPVHWAGQPHAQVWHPQPYYGPGSANVTPIPRSASTQLLRGRSSTPWKPRGDSASALRRFSPTRPSKRDVSPISDTESPSRSTNPRKPIEKNENLLSAQEARGRQGASTTPGIGDSRSHSIASFISETQTPTEKKKRGRPPSKIKAEPPSTPAPMLSDTEPQQSTGRAGRPRKSTVTSRNEQPQTAMKRKRSHARDSVTPPLPSSAHAQLRRQPSHDSTLVSVSKNFSKTAQLLLNDITSHKLAGIFAKPLSERDAPGYKDLIFRPQDLKSIKAAVSKGGRAALAAIEALEEDKTVEETPTKNAPGPETTGERPLGNGMYLVKKTEELLPPKGIVNSSQLEKELVRMFANAVMFNPLPTSERGFGRSLRPRKQGGDYVAHDHDADAGSSTSSSSSEEGSPADEGGIISDAREMFDDVMVSIRKWRDVELERLGGGEDAAASASSLKATHPQGRHSSVSSALNEDDGGGESAAASTPVPTTGTARKRRRVAE